MFAACNAQPRPAVLAPKPIANVADPAPRCTTADECVALADKMIEAPVVVARNPTAAAAGNERALELFGETCARNHPRACERVGELLENHPYYGLSADPAAAATAFDKACELGNAHACYWEGFAVWEGLLDHVVEDGKLRRINWPADKRLGAKLLYHACNDMQQPDACKLIGDLVKAGVL
jgi:TPR repeat protein